MRLSYLRFTTRRMMVVIAALGIAMGGGVWGVKMWRLSRYYASQAEDHKAFEDLWLLLEGRTEELAERIEERGAKEQEAAAREREAAARQKEKAAFHAALNRKYQQAARYPWRSVEPDLPEPQ